MEKENGEILYFYNPDLGKFSDENCGVKETYLTEKFKITYEPGQVEIYDEGGGGTQILDKDVITSIELVDSSSFLATSDTLISEKDKLRNLVDGFGGLPERKEYKCSNCNESNLGSIDVCDKKTVQEALVNSYWYGVRHTRTSGSSYKLEYVTECIFFPNGKLLLLNKSEYYQVVDYTVEICQTVKKNGKTSKVARVNYSVTQTDLAGNTKEVEVSLELFEWDASGMVGVSNSLVRGPANKSFIVKVLSK